MHVTRIARASERPVQGGVHAHTLNIAFDAPRNPHMNRKTQYGFWYANGLSITLALVFVGCLCAQFASGWIVWNNELARAGQPALDFLEYFGSGHFVSATFENWESEFLQMGMYVLLTVWLRQRGSAESRPLDPSCEHEEIEPGPRPWPLRVGGLWRRIYAMSLSLALFSLFAMSAAGHALGSWHHANDLRRIDGEPAIAFLDFVRSAQFWFESMQNWQSEFLAVLALVLLSIFLRQDKSPESKPLEAPHRQTGG